MELSATAIRATDSRSSVSPRGRLSQTGGIALIDFLGMLLLLRSAVLDCHRLFLAHIGTPLRVTVTLAAAEMIDLRTKIGPHHRISGTVGFGLGFIRVLT